LASRNRQRRAHARKRHGHSARHLTPAAVRTSTRSQLTAALTSLRKREPSDADVHSARKCIKKARARLRLLREVLGSSVYERDDEALRDAARPLSATRDAKILIDVLDSMVERRAIDAESVDALRCVLVTHREQVQRRTAASHKIADARRNLRAVQRRSIHWMLSRADDSALLVRALRGGYRRARRAMSDAQDDPKADVLHEWRKQVKYLWHQLQIFEPFEPGVRELAEASHRLADYLGDDHDLAVLRDCVVARRNLLPARSRKSFIAQIDKRRVALERHAFALGRRLFSEKPKAFAKRVARP
jgi:CHAD domain-containing protein